jgi:HAD superfamily hydrolase (TIGR01509 family)
MFRMPVSIRAIIFDIGNVLLRFDFNLAVQKLMGHCTPASEKIQELIEPVKVAYEAGRVPRADFQAQVRTILTYTGTDEHFIDAWEDIFSPNNLMVQLVRRLHDRLPLYLLSNTNDIHLDFILRTYPFFRYFKDGVYSFKAHAAKPDPEIYEIARRQFGVVPAETLFIDDLAPNIEAARSLGFQVHHYEMLHHERLLEQLHAGGAL